MKFSPAETTGSSTVFYWADNMDKTVDITGVSGKVVDYEILGDKIYMISIR